MVPSIIQKLLRNQSQSAIKTICYFPRSQQLLPPFLLNDVSQISAPNYQIPFFNHPITEDLKSKSYILSHFYPTFPFGFKVNTVSPIISIRSETDEETTPDDTHTIRADSVKKKRKKKMNKHKLRKLRKRLRRKT